MTSFAEAFGAFLSDVGASLQEFVDNVSKPEAATPAATSQAATAQRPTVPTQAPTVTRNRANSTRVRLDLDVAHDGSAQELHREFQDYARTHGRSENAATLVQFLQGRQGVTPRSWSAVDYAGVGSRS